MKALIEELLSALIIQRKIESLSPAARAMAEKHISNIEHQARTAAGIVDYTRPSVTFNEIRLARELLALEAEVNLEIKTWRMLGADVAPLLERLLASQGDKPDLQILQLQHSLAEIRARVPNSPPAPKDCHTLCLVCEINHRDGGLTYLAHAWDEHGVGRVLIAGNAEHVNVVRPR